MQSAHSSIHTLCPSIDLKTPLSHLRILQKIHRHPHQVALDLCQLLLRLLRRHELVENMAGLDASRRKETIVIVKRFDYFWISLCNIYILIVIFTYYYYLDRRGIIGERVPCSDQLDLSTYPTARHQVDLLQISNYRHHRRRYSWARHSVALH